MITIEEFQYICNLVVELTRLKLKEVPHLCIENFAPELLNKLMIEKNRADEGKEYEA